MMKDTDGKLNKYNQTQKVLCGFVFGIMLVYLLMQFRNVMVYFDDYGYYSLSYGVYNPNASTNFSLGELFDYMCLHYKHANGRVLWFFIWLFIYWIGDLALVQIAAAFITMGVLVAIWKYTSRKETKVVSAIYICALYGLFPIELQQHGTYWLCPFFLYVAPVLPLMIFFMIYTEGRKCGFTLLQKFMMTVLVLFSAFSQEQLAVSVLFMMVLLLVWDVLEKRNSSFNFLLILTALFSVAALVLNPGLQNRASAYDAPLIDRIMLSTELVIRMFFAKSMKPFVIVLFVALAAISLSLFKKENGYMRWLDLCSIGYAFFSICVYSHEGILNKMQYFFESGTKLILVGIFAVCIILVQFFRAYFITKQFDRLVLFMTAVASVGCLCFVPELPFRLFLPSWLLLFPLLTDGVVTLGGAVKKNLAKYFYIGLACFMLLFFSVSNSLDIYNGYASNAEIHQYNDMIMKKAAAQEKNGDLIDRIYLKEIPNPEYSSVMIYQQGIQFIKPWMMNYYGISSDPELYFSTDGGSFVSQDESFVDTGLEVFLKVKTIKIKSIYDMYSAEGILTLAIDCDPIYTGCQIDVNGITYPTVVGNDIISAVIGKVNKPLSISVVVPHMGLQSDIVTVSALE